MDITNTFHIIIIFTFFYCNDVLHLFVSIRLKFNVINFIFLVVQLKYHDTGREKVCSPRVGQWNMMNKVLHRTASDAFYVVKPAYLY